MHFGVLSGTFAPIFLKTQSSDFSFNLEISLSSAQSEESFNLDN